MEKVRGALREMLGPKVGIGVTDPALASNLWPEEAAAVKRAVPKRQTEFAAGRRAGRMALAELGLAPVAIPQGENRAPIWPTGFSGSISHCAQCCIAVAAHNRDYQTLGVDVEPATALDPDLITLICNSSEQVWVANQSNPGLAAMMIFSAKEAVYKAQYPLTEKVIGYDAVTIQCANSDFTVAATSELPAMKGATLVQEGLILTVAHV